MAKNSRSLTGGRAEFSGFLGPGTKFTGDLVFEDPLQILGVFKGNIKTESTLTIAKSGEVEADIQVGVLIVQGRITGKVRATDRVEIHSGGRVVGDIRAPNLITREGAIFRGNCFIGEEEDSSARPVQAERAFFKGA